MSTLCEIAVYQDGNKPVPDQTMILEGVKEAVRRMQEIRLDHPAAVFRFFATAGIPEGEIEELSRRAAAAGCNLERTYP